VVSVNKDSVLSPPVDTVIAPGARVAACSNGVLAAIVPVCGAD
jgi:hypothetical protein